MKSISSLRTKIDPFLALAALALTPKADLSPATVFTLAAALKNLEPPNLVVVPYTDPLLAAYSSMLTAGWMLAYLLSIFLMAIALNLLDFMLFFLPLFLLNFLKSSSPSES